MTDRQITSLASEYAEQTDGSPADIAYIKAIAENTIRFLLRRYCLVEKQLVIKQLDYAQKLIEDRNYLKQHIGVGSYSILERIFPEIEKEVEE